MRLYVETSTLIYFVEDHPVYAEIVLPIFAAIEGGEIDAFTSFLTLLEVLVKPYAEDREDLASEYRDILAGTPHLELVPMAEGVADRAARIRARTGLRAPDAIHAATATEGGADTFLTNDTAFTRLDGLHVLVLDELARGDDPVANVEEALGIGLEDIP